MDADRLLAAVQAALDERERIARSATPGPWATTGGLFRGECSIEAANGHEVAMTFSCGDAEHGSNPPADAEHIAANDPATVLRLVAAMRDIAERHQPRMLPAMPYRPAMSECEHCASQCHSRSGLGCDEPIDAPWPCPDFAALAHGLGINPEEETG